MTIHVDTIRTSPQRSYTNLEREPSEDLGWPFVKKDMAMGVSLQCDCGARIFYLRDGVHPETLHM